MKIIILGPAHPFRGGPASFNDRLAKQFIEEGQSVEVFTFRMQYPAILFPGKTQYNDSPAPCDIKITRILNSINPFNWIVTGLKLRKKRPDLLLVRFWMPFFGPSFGTVMRIVKSNKKTKVICIFDNVIPHEKRPGDKILTKFFISVIDGAIVMSRNVSDDLFKFRRNIPAKLSPHPLFDNYGKLVGREEALKGMGLDARFSYLLFFGFVRAYKGLDLLIDAFSDKRLRNRNIKLIVAGEFYEDSAPYRNQINENNIGSDVIIFDRFIKDSEVSYLFSLADIVVQPYKTATQSGVTQIAFHFGKPMLVTDVGGLKEIVNHMKCGYVVKPNAGEITEALLDFYENSKKAAFEEGVQEEKIKFSWDKMTGSINEVFNKTVSGEM
jgi:D-inositol-3-phosphate glycosyltransferase